jgi:hypothetical protein
VEFGVEIGDYHGVVRVPWRVFQHLLPERPTLERCVEAYYLQRTRFESVAQRKLRRRQLTEDGNVEISGRDLRLDAGAEFRRGSPSPPTTKEDRWQATHASSSRSPNDAFPSVSGSAFRREVLASDTRK